MNCNEKKSLTNLFNGLFNGLCKGFWRNIILLSIIMTFSGFLMACGTNTVTDEPTDTIANLSDSDKEVGEKSDDVPSIAPIDEADPVEELDPDTTDPTIAPEVDEIGNDIEQCGNEDEVIEVTPTVAPESTSATTPEPTKAPTPTPTVASTPTPTLALTPTPIVEKDDEYDKAMYDKFIKAGAEFHKIMISAKVIPDSPEMLSAIYAFEYVVNAEYINESTTKRLVDDGIVFMENLKDSVSYFGEINLKITSHQQLNNQQILNITDLCLDNDDKKNSKPISEAIANTIETGDNKVVSDYAYDFIKAGINDKSTRFPQTLDKMSNGVKAIYYVYTDTYRKVLDNKNQSDLSDELANVRYDNSDIGKGIYSLSIELMNKFYSKDFSVRDNLKISN